MRYTEEEVDSTSRLMVDALYGIKTIDDAMEQMYDKEVKAYLNFKLYVKYLKNQLEGKTVHFATPCNWAKAHYKYLNNEDKLKFLDAMERQVEYDSQYDTPSHKLKKWIKSQRILNHNKITIIYPDDIEDNNLFEGTKNKLLLMLMSEAQKQERNLLKSMDTNVQFVNLTLKKFMEKWEKTLFMYII